MPEISRRARRAIAVTFTFTLVIALLSPAASWACGNGMVAHELGDDGGAPSRQLLVAAGLSIGALFGLRRMAGGHRRGEGFVTSFVMGCVVAVGPSAPAAFAAVVLPATQVQLLLWISGAALAWIALSIVGSVAAWRRASQPRNVVVSSPVRRGGEHRRAA